MAQGEDPVQILARRLLDIRSEELPAREKRIIEKVAKRLAVSRNISLEFEEQRTFGERLADRVAEIGGSWAFLITFGLFIVVWTAGNAILVLLGPHAVDPYPFIFLNLILSLLAAVQAPIIMMSQNRASAKDRIAAGHDYEVNLKAEIEIAALHEKLDSIRSQELAKLVERVEKALTASAK